LRSTFKEVPKFDHFSILVKKGAQALAIKLFEEIFNADLIEKRTQEKDWGTAHFVMLRNGVVIELVYHSEWGEEVDDALHPAFRLDDVEGFIKELRLYGTENGFGELTVKRLKGGKRNVTFKSCLWGKIQLLPAA